MESTEDTFASSRPELYARMLKANPLCANYEARVVTIDAITYWNLKFEDPDGTKFGLVVTFETASSADDILVKIEWAEQNVKTTIGGRPRL